MIIRGSQVRPRNNADLRPRTTSERDQFFVGECGSARAQRSGGNPLVRKKHRDTQGENLKAGGNTSTSWSPQSPGGRQLSQEKVYKIVYPSTETAYTHR